ncbi:MAG: MarR family winged helix-turn-helix transcriptional regulator [Pseudomonadota bacterium]
MPEPKDDPISYRIFNEIGIIHQLATAAFKKVLPPPLNPSMFGVLNHFARLGDGKTPSYLADAFQVTRPAMTAILEKLSAAGFVRIERDSEDARGKRVWITPDGREARGQAVKATATLFADIEPALKDIDREALLTMLTHLRQTLDEAR